jgi:predicted DNA-binding transcriptional regulator AlpA
MLADALTPAAEPLLYTRRQVAAMLGLCEKSVWQLSRDGKLPVVRVTDRAVRYSRDDILTFIEAAKGKGERP